jgi:serine phosphatase RsbU (regulator of sigma subunit)
MTETPDRQRKEFGIERLRKAFLAMREKPADEIPRALIQKVKEYAQGAPLPDDCTVVVVKRLVEPVPAEQRPTGEARLTGETKADA